MHVLHIVVGAVMCSIYMITQEQQGTVTWT